MSRARAEFSEIGVVMMAGLTVVGALVGPWLPGVPLRFGLLGLAVALAVRSPAWVLIIVFVLAATRANQETARYQLLEARPYEGIVQLITDPEENDLGARAESALSDGSRVRLTAYGPLAAALSQSSAGDRFVVSGDIGAIQPSRWSQSRHIVGSLNSRTLERIEGTDWFRRPSEWLRDAVRAGAAHLPTEHQPLYLGLVIGDDRAQTVVQQARFRTAGLAHLLAVSGQNVAFVLAVAAPALRRLGHRPRFVGIVMLLAVFAIATRLEPSVLRATVTAGLGAWAVVSGRRSTGLRLLGLAVTALVLIDPFLVWSISFQLSVAASAAIIVLGPVIARRLPGPAWLVEATAVTVAAQVGVAPILLGAFGPVSLVTIPANVLAGWAAGLVMIWGMSIGLVVGLMPDITAVRLAVDVVQRPAGWLVAWIDVIGTWGATAPFPALGARSALGIVAAMVGVWLAGVHHLLRLMALVIVAVAAIAALPGPPSEPAELSGGGRWFPSTSGDPSILIVGPAADERLIESLIEARVRAVDVVVVTGSSRRAGRLGNDIVELVTPGLVLAPPRHRVHDGQRLLEPVTIRSGQQVIDITPWGDRLDVTVDVRQALGR